MADDLAMALARIKLAIEQNRDRAVSLHPDDARAILKAHNIRPYTPPRGYSEPDGTYRHPDTGAHRTARCEGSGRLVSRGNGKDSVTDGTIIMSVSDCPNCNPKEK